MRFLTTIIFLVCGWYTCYSQDCNPNKQRKPASHKTTEKRLSCYRILVAEYDPDSLKVIRIQSKQFTVKYRRNSYIVKKDGKLQLLLGDFYALKDAERSLNFCMKNYGNSEIVRSCNDFLVEYSSVDSILPPCSVFDTAALHPDPGMFRDQGYYWVYPKYAPANTAKDEDYLTENEKQLFYYLNLARMLPSLFADVFLPAMRYSTDKHQSSLVADLKGMAAAPALRPDRMLHESARCHSMESGELGYEGHGRSKCEQYFRAECIQYGVLDPLDMIIGLLVDHGWETYAHRSIMLDPVYNTLGVSIQPHITYHINAVLDLGIDQNRKR